MSVIYGAERSHFVWHKTENNLWTYFFQLERADAQIWQTESIQCTSRDRSWIMRHANETNWSMAKELVLQNVGWEGGGEQDWQKDNHPELNTSIATFTERVFMRQILNEVCAVIDHKWSTASWHTPSLGSQHGWSNLTKILSLCLSSLSPPPQTKFVPIMFRSLCLPNQSFIFKI